MCTLRGGKITLIRDDGTHGLYFIPHCNSIKIGSSIQCDIRIENDAVRKVHCMIYPDSKNNVIQIKNLSKKNPVRLNGKLIKKYNVLNHDDIISFCQKQFLWSYVPPKYTKRLSSGVGEEEIVDLDGDEEVPQTDQGDGTSLDKTLVKCDNQVKKINRRYTCKINKIPIGNIAKRLKATKRITIHELGNGPKLDDSWVEQDEENCEENAEADINPENTITPTIRVAEYVDTGEISLDEKDVDVENDNVTASRSTVKYNNTTPLKDITKLQEKNIMTTPRTHTMFPLEASTPFQSYENKNLSVLKLSKMEKSDSLVWSVSPSTISRRSKKFEKSFTGNSHNNTIITDLIDVDTSENTVIKKTVTSLVYLIDLTTPDTSNNISVQRTPNKSVIKSTTLLKSAIKNSSNILKSPKTGLHGTANAAINKLDRKQIVTANSVKKVLNMTNTLGTPKAQNRKSLFLNKTVTPHSTGLREPPQSTGHNYKSEMDKSGFITVSDTSNATLRKTMTHATPAKTPVKERVATPGRAKSFYGEAKASEVVQSPFKSHRSDNSVIRDDLTEVTACSFNTPGKSDVSNISSAVYQNQTSDKFVTSKDLTEEVQNKCDITNVDLAKVSRKLNEFETNAPSNDIIEDRSAKEIIDTTNDLRNVQGANDLSTSDKYMRTNALPDEDGVKELLNTPVHGDLQDVGEVTQLMKTPGKHIPTDDLTDVIGVRELLSTPARDELRDVRGVKELMKTPGRHIPLNDLTDVAGVKELLNTPARDDLRDVAGVKELMKTPGRHTPTNDLTNVIGVKELLNTPPRDDLTDVRGVKEIFNTPYEGHNPDFTVNFDTITNMINTSHDFESGSKNVSVCTLPSIDIAPDSINVDDFDEADDRDDDTEFNEDFISETKTMDETFDELIGKKHITKTYLRNKSFEKRNNLTESQTENIEKWIDSVAVTPKPNNNQQILSNRYSNVTPQASVIEPPDYNLVDNDNDDDHSDSQSSHNSKVEAEFKRISISDPVDRRVSFRYENYDLSFRSEGERTEANKIQGVLDESALLNEEANDIIPSTQLVETPRRYTRTQRESLHSLNNSSKDTYVIEDEEAVIPETQFEVFQGDPGDDSNDCDLHMSSQVLDTNISLVLNGEEEILSSLVNSVEGDDNSRETYIFETQMQNEGPAMIPEEKDESSILFIDDTIFMEKGTGVPAEIESDNPSDDSSIILCDGNAINVVPLNLRRTRSKSETPKKVIHAAPKATRKTIGNVLNETSIKINELQQEIEEGNFDEKKSVNVIPQKLSLTSPVVKNKSITVVDLSDSLNESSIEEADNLQETPYIESEVNPIVLKPKSPFIQSKLITTIDLSESLDRSARNSVNLDKDQDVECEISEAKPTKLSKFEEEVKQSPPNISENIEYASIPRIKSKSISPKKQEPKLSSNKNKSIATIDLSESVNESTSNSIDLDEPSEEEFGSNEISGVEHLKIEEQPSREITYENSDDEMMDTVFDHLEKDTSVNASNLDLTNKSASQLMVAECLEMDSDVFENFNENEIVQQARATSLSPENVVKSTKISRKTFGDQSDMQEIIINKFCSNVSADKAKSDHDGTTISSADDPAELISCWQIVESSSISIAETSNENVIDEAECNSQPTATDVTSTSIGQNIASILPEDSGIEGGMQVRSTPSKSETPKKIIREACKSTRKTMGDPAIQTTGQISRIHQELEQISRNVENQVSCSKLSLSEIDESSNANDGSACVLIYTDSEDEMIDSVFDNLQNDSSIKESPKYETKSGSRSMAEGSSEIDPEVFNNFNENEVVRQTIGRASLSPRKPVTSQSSRSSRKTMGDKLDGKEKIISKFASEINDINMSLGGVEDAPSQVRRRAMSIGNKPKSPSEYFQNKTVCEMRGPPDSETRSGLQSMAEESSEIFKNFNENEVVRQASGRVSLSPIKSVKSQSSKSSRKTMGDKLNMKEEKISKFASEVNDINLSLGDIEHAPLQTRRRARSIGIKTKSNSENFQNKTVCEINYDEPIVEVSTCSEIEESVQKLDAKHDISCTPTDIVNKDNHSVVDTLADADVNLDDTFEHDESESLFNGEEESEFIVPETQEIPVDSSFSKKSERILIIPETQPDESEAENETSQPDKLIHNRSTQLHRLSLNSPSRTKSPKLSMKSPSPKGKEWPKILIEQNSEVERAIEDLKETEIINLENKVGEIEIKQDALVGNSEVVVENDKSPAVNENIKEFLTPAARNRRLYSKDSYTPLFEEDDDSVVNFQNNPTSTPFDRTRANIGEFNISENEISSTEPTKRVLDELVLLNVPKTTVVDQKTQEKIQGVPSLNKKESVPDKSVDVEIKTTNAEITLESGETMEIKSKEAHSVNPDSEVTTSTPENINDDITSNKEEMIIANIDADNLRIARRVAFTEKPEEKYFEVLSEYEESLIQPVRGRRGLVHNKPAPKEEPIVKKPRGRPVRQQKTESKVQIIEEDSSSLAFAVNAVQSESTIDVIEQKNNRGRSKRVITAKQTDETSKDEIAPSSNEPEILIGMSKENITKTSGRNKARQAQDTETKLTLDSNIKEDKSEKKTTLVEPNPIETANDEIVEQKTVARKGRRPAAKATKMEVEEVKYDKHEVADDEETLMPRGRNRRRRVKETVEDVSNSIEQSVTDHVEPKEGISEKVIEPKKAGRGKSRQPPIREPAPGEKEETNESEEAEATEDEVFEPKTFGRSKNRRQPIKKKSAEEIISVEKGTEQQKTDDEIGEKIYGRAKPQCPPAKKLESEVVEVVETETIIGNKIDGESGKANVEIIEQGKSDNDPNRQTSIKNTHTNVEQNEEDLTEQKKPSRGKNRRQPAKKVEVVSVEEKEAFEDKALNNSEHINTANEEIVEPIKSERGKSRRPPAKKSKIEGINESNTDEPANIETVPILEQEDKVNKEITESETVDIKTTGRGKGRRAPIRKKEVSLDELKSKEIEQNLPKSPSAKAIEQKSTGRGRGRRALAKKDSDVMVSSANEEPEMEEASQIPAGRGRRAIGTKKDNEVTSTAGLSGSKGVLTVDVILDSTTPEETENSDVKTVSSSKPIRGKAQGTPSILVATLVDEVFATPTKPAVRGRRPANKNIIHITDSESEQVSESPVLNRRRRPIKKPSRYQETTASDADASSNEHEDKTHENSSRGRKIVVNKQPGSATPVISRGRRGVRKQSENGSVIDTSSKEVSQIASHDETPSISSTKTNKKEVPADKDNTTVERGRGRRAKPAVDTNISIESVSEEAPIKKRGRRAAVLPADKPIVPAKRGRKAKNDEVSTDTNLLDAESTESIQEPTPISTKSRKNEIEAAENITKPSSSSKLKRKAKETPNETESKSADTAKVTRVTRARAK